MALKIFDICDVLELACTGSQELTVCIFPQLQDQWRQVGSLKLTMVGVFTPWNQQML